MKAIILKILNIFLELHNFHYISKKKKQNMLHDFKDDVLDILFFTQKSVAWTCNKIEKIISHTGLTVYSSVATIYAIHFDKLEIVRNVPSIYIKNNSSNIFEILFNKKTWDLNVLNILSEKDFFQFLNNEQRINLYRELNHILTFKYSAATMSLLEKLEITMEKEKTNTQN